MSEDTDNIQYSPIRNYDYGRFFRDVQYNGTALNQSERAEFIKVSDETIADYSKGLPLTNQILVSIKDRNDDFHIIQRTIVSVMQFVLITIIDNMVICKYFILADKDYDKRFMRGKMKVILNEGFKQLYGFGEKAHKESEWHRLEPILKYFPDEIKQQYIHLTNLLNQHSITSTWWRDERVAETHLDAEKLYASRCDEVNESKVMMESLKLFDTLFAVVIFLTNMHACLRNFLVEMYHQGKLKEE